MNAVAKSAVYLLPTILIGVLLRANAQLATTQLDRLQVNVSAIKHTSDVDCFLWLEFAGEQTQNAVDLSQLNIIQAVDDTGMSLVRTPDRQHGPEIPTRPWKSAEGWTLPIRLKSPSVNAKTIRRLEAEVMFLDRTADTPILTNFLSRPGAVLHQATLDKYQVAISYRSPLDSSPGGQDKTAGKVIVLRSPEKTRLLNSTISLEIDDPQNLLTSVAFQSPDGSFLSSTNTTLARGGSHKTWTYIFSEVPPPNLNLVVYMGSPETSHKVSFVIENIRLPWVELPDFQVSVVGPPPLKRISSDDTNSCAGTLGLQFAGGQLTNALGIRKLWITKAEIDSGQEVKVDYWRLGTMEFQWRLDWLADSEGKGRSVTKFVPLRFPSGKGKSIRVLQGEAEFILPNATNEGRLVLKDFMNHAGAPLGAPLLTATQVKIVYRGPVNYAAKHSEFVKNDTDIVFSLYPVSADESLPDNMDSIQFSLEDPDRAVIQLYFQDNNGQVLPDINEMRSGNSRVYRFKTIPPPETQLVLCLAIPESVRRVPFKLENISLR